MRIAQTCNITIIFGPNKHAELHNRQPALKFLKQISYPIIIVHTTIN